MNIFSRLLSNHKWNNDNYQRGEKCNTGDDFLSFFSAVEENGDILPIHPRYGDSYLYNAWVNIAVNILIRNIARADFTIKRGGNDVTSGSLYELFRRPNPALSRFDLWKETAAWWNLEGEVF
jgi:hypothetical protein